MFYNFANEYPAASVARLHKQGSLLRNFPATEPAGLGEQEQPKPHASGVREPDTPECGPSWTSLLSGFKWLTEMIVLADVYGRCLEGCHSAFLPIGSSPGVNQHRSVVIIIPCLQLLCL